MPSLQVRDLPETLYKKLLFEAEKDHRSLAQQAIAILTKGLGITDDNKERRQKLLANLREMPIKLLGKSHKNPAQIVREDRAR